MIRQFVRKWLRERAAKRRAVRFMELAIKEKVKALNKESAKERQRRGI